MGRKILFVTTDQQRYDALGCTGNTIARTPVVDALAADGIVYRPGPQPEHGVHAGALHHDHGPVRAHPRRRSPTACRCPVDAPVGGRAPSRHRGIPHRPRGQGPLPARLRPRRQVDRELPGRGRARPGPYRGFDHVELAMHGYLRRWHYDKWLEANGPQWLDAFYPLINFASMGLNDEGGGDTDAPEVKHNPMPRGMYHTDWVADRTIAWLDSLDPDDDWFCWMSFPDPHHPWDPPVDEVRRRVDWRELDLPPGPSRIDRQGGRDPGAEAPSLARLVRGALPEHGGRAR